MTADTPDVATAADTRPRPRWHPATWPWWVQVLAVYGAARAWSAVVLMVVAERQVENLWTPASPSYLQFTGLMWDASWYRSIAEQGYPAELPLDDAGQVRQNAWAFFPLFPALVRVLMLVTGAPWEVVAPLLALALGAAAVLVVHRVVERGAPRAVAARPGLPLATVALVSVFPTSVVLQVGYTESLALLLVATSLLLVLTRRYGWAALAVVALGFTRAVAAPMLAVVLVHAVVRWREHRRGGDPLTPGDVAQVAGLAVVAALSGVAWPVVCGLVTGRPDAYLLTQGTWRGSGDVVPLEPWGYVSRYWFGSWAPLVLVAAAAVVVGVVASRSARRQSAELQTWSIAYLGYLVLAVEPGTSLARFLLLAFPLGAATAGLVARDPVRRRAWLAAVVVVMALLQLVWVDAIWRLVPPSGWPP